MSKPRTTQTSEPQWAQAPDGTWVALPQPAAPVVVEQRSSGCLAALGVAFLLLVVLPVVFVIGVTLLGASSGKPKAPTTTTTQVVSPVSSSPAG